MRASFKSARSCGSAFSLVELLVVIAIIGILASLLLPSIVAMNNRAKISRARSEVESLRVAIAQYRAVYGRYPVSWAALNLTVGGQPQGPYDFTYGTVRGNGPELLAGGNGQQLPNITYSKDDPIANLVYFDYQANNSEVISILMDIDQFPTPGAPPTVNAKHMLNPKRHVFINPPRKTGVRAAGVGEDLVYRDPWGNPYIISLDLAGDGVTTDAFYRMAHMTQRVGADEEKAKGQVGLIRAVPPEGFKFPATAHYGDRHIFEIRDSIVVWSMGPDGLADVNWKNAIEQKAELGVNKDNILSWWR